MLLLAPAHVLQFGVQLLVGGKDASGHHGFCQHVRPEPVLLLLVFLQVESLVPQQRAGSLDNGTEDAVKGSQHHYIEEEDADAQYKRPEHRKDIYRLGTGKGLPHPVSNVEQGSQCGQCHPHIHHRLAELGHRIVQIPQNLVQVFK